jgi:hypothetical protein
MLKLFKGRLGYCYRLGMRHFSTSEIDIYPDTIITRLRDTAANKHAGDDAWASVEVDILEKINFFDSDQYVDTVCILADADKGTELLWDILSRKIYDYELDVPQSAFLVDSLNHTSKMDKAILDPIARNVLTAKMNPQYEFIKKL